MATLKAKVYRILEAGHSHNWQSQLFESAMATLIGLNVVLFSIETVPHIAEQYRVPFLIFDVASIAIFTLEYAARMWVCTEHPPFAGLSPTRARMKFARSPFMLVDFFAIAPFYFSFILPLDFRVLRIFRLLRFFKLARYSPAFNTMLRVISAESSALLGVLIVMIGMIIFAASLLYLVEGHAQPDKFGTVPQAMWWAIATLTTVGYGDAYPITVAGKNPRRDGDDFRARLFRAARGHHRQRVYGRVSPPRFRGDLGHGCADAGFLNRSLPKRLPRCLVS